MRYGRDRWRPAAESGRVGRRGRRQADEAGCRGRSSVVIMGSDAGEAMRGPVGRTTTPNPEREPEHRWAVAIRTGQKLPMTAGPKSLYPSRCAPALYSQWPRSFGHPRLRVVGEVGEQPLAFPKRRDVIVGRWNDCGCNGSKSGRLAAVGLSDTSNQAIRETGGRAGYKVIALSPSSTRASG